jgi:hypothetical protein
MNVGLPGSGIGGAFYLLSALCMPIVALVRQLRSRPAGWGGALRQAAMAVGIVAGLAMAASLAGVLLAQTPVGSWAARGVTDVHRIPAVFRTASVVIALGTLGCLVCGVWVAAFVVHGPAAFRGSIRRAAPAIDPPRRVPRVSSDR